METENNVSRVVISFESVDSVKMHFEAVGVSPMQMWAAAHWLELQADMTYAAQQQQAAMKAAAEAREAEIASIPRDHKSKRN